MNLRNGCILFLLALGVAACGGGGGGGGGEVVGGGGTLPEGIILNPSGTVSYAQTTPATYSFNTTGMHAYSTKLVSTQGDADLFVTSQPLSENPGDLFGFSLRNGVDFVNFIVPSSMTAYASVFAYSDPSASYNLQVFDNHLTVDGPARTREAGDQTIYFSFDAVAGQAYSVKITPIEGDPSLSVYTDTKASFFSPAGLEPDGLVAISDNTGAQAESVVFVATETKTHYLAVSNMYFSADISFSASVGTAEAAADLRVSINSLSYSQGEVTVNYTVSNAGIAPSTGVDLDFWLDSGTPPVSGSVGDASVVIDAIAPGSDYTGSAIISVGALESGTFYAYVDPEDVLPEVDETNNVSTGWNWATPVQGAQSFDFEDGSIPVDLMASGNAGWEIDASTASSGIYSIRASSITDSQSACIAVTAANSSAITFDWKVDSESNWDYLRFYIDGSEQAGGISGTVDWVGKSFSGLAAGTHEYKWCYIKDSSLSSGSDTAWVDNIQVN